MSTKWNKIICFLMGHKPKIACGDDWSDSKGRIPARYTVRYCTRCLLVLKEIFI